MTWVVDNLDLIGRLTVEHLRQSALPILLGLLLSIPLGWLAFRFRLTRGLMLTVVGLLYTIPSLALFALLPPLLGISFLSEINLVIALTIYAVAIMTRFVADALASVEPHVRQAADAVGYGAWRRFWQVDLPLAGPVVLAGLRVTAVSTISLCTVGILIGIDNLGYLFTNGYQRQIVAEILAGVVAVVVIALVIDRLLVVLGRALMPWAGKGA
ncbi:ABC transporter permease [Isoptericola chiayiensis]|uniref:ABC transporter permease n=1 Tax=Isoptericola chiayiensis TaxID=579446 RepID=A0ABP8XZV8_9MICO|nr:ABC transporter permease subunit [Isoptericola chiayiensis]NOW01174.1 osmoprotectant transport system permease protein [Isoptericola chiayiensis]